MRQPVAVCEVCGHHAHNPASINEQCSQRYDGQRCRGVYGSRLNHGDWATCPVCDGLGARAGTRCETCEGDGMVDVRP